MARESFSKRLLEKHPDKKPTAKLKAKAQSPGGRGKGRRKRKGEEEETSFEEMMGKKNKMTKNMTNMKGKIRVKTQNQRDSFRGTPFRSFLQEDLKGLGARGGRETKV